MHHLLLCAYNIKVLHYSLAGFKFHVHRASKSLHVETGYFIQLFYSCSRNEKRRAFTHDLLFLWSMFCGCVPATSTDDIGRIIIIPWTPDRELEESWPNIFRVDAAWLTCTTLELTMEQERRNKGKNGQTDRLRRLSEHRARTRTYVG